VVRARTRDGREHPLTLDELRAKFRDNVAGALAQDTVAAVEESVARLGSGTRPDELLALVHDLKEQGHV
jgi:hypothetical protein